MTTKQKKTIPTVDYSQNGEQAFLTQYFALNRPAPKPRVYVEVGAYDGQAYSNTKHLQALGWAGVLVEPNNDMFNRLLKNRADANTGCYEVALVGDESIESVQFHIYDSVPYMSGVAPLDQKVAPEHMALRVPMNHRIETVKAMTLNAVLETYFEGDVVEIDFISLDTEGTEKDVLRGLNFDKWKPRLLCIETNDPRNADLDARMEERGYEAIHRNNINTFYERVDNGQI